MADCSIQDKWGYWTGAGVFTGVPSLKIFAIPDLNTRRYSVSGTYRNLGTGNPGITSDAFKYGRTSSTGSVGDYTLALPQGGSSKPTTPEPKWSIVLPDGKVLTGVVPDVAGPLTLDDLETTYSWTWATSVYVAPAVPGQLARGRKTLTATDTSIVVYDSPFAADPKITLTPSVDSVTGDVPTFGYTSNSLTGFTIKMGGVFTGTVDWEAKV